MPLLRREGYLTSRRGAGSFAELPVGAGAATAGLPYLGEADEGVIDLTVAAPTALAETFLEAAGVALEQLPLHLRGDGYRVLGLPELREAVAELHRARSPHHRRAGDDHERRAGRDRTCCARLPGPGAAVLVESPTYPNALDSFLAASARLVTVPVGDGWDAELVESSFRQAVPRLAYFTPDFNNPTGRLTLSDERARARPRRAASGHARARGRELPRPRPRRRPAGRRAARRPRLRARHLGRRPQQERLGRPAHRLGAVDACARPAPRRGAAEHGHRQPAARAARRAAAARGSRRDARRAAAPARDSGSKRSPTRSRRSCPSGRSRCRTAGSASGSALDRSSTSLVGPAARAGVRIVPGPRFGIDGTLERFLRLPFVLPPATLREAVSRLATAASDVPRLAELHGRGQLRRLARPRAACGRGACVRGGAASARPSSRTAVHAVVASRKRRSSPSTPKRRRIAGERTTAIRPPRSEQALTGREQRVHARRPPRRRRGSGRRGVASRRPRVRFRPRARTARRFAASSKPSALTMAMRTPDETAASSGPQPPLAPDLRR